MNSGITHPRLRRASARVPLPAAAPGGNCLRGLAVRGLPRGALPSGRSTRIAWRLLQRGAAEVTVPIFPNSVQ